MTNVMKNSGFQWIGDIPQNWEMRRVKWCFCQKKEKARIEDPTVLSLARDGIKVRDISTNEGQLAADYTNYNPVEPGDLLLNPMDLYSGDNCNISKISGVISPAYVNLKTINGNIPEFYNYYFKTQYWTMAFFAHGKGVSFENRWTLTNETLRNYPVVLPNPIQQKKIADYLDDKCGKIDQAIEGQKKIIEKLKEYKQSVITEAVTKGLDPNVPMKDSGIEWIGQIPEHWKIIKFKYLFEIIGGNGFPDKLQGIETGDYPFCKCSDINGKQLYIETAKNWVTQSIVNEYKFNIIPKNSILIPKIGEALKKNHRKINKCECIVDNNMQALIPKSSSNILFKYYLTSIINMLWFDNGGTVPSINNSKLKNFFVPKPSSDEQTKISSYLEEKCKKIDFSIQQKEETIEKLTEYKKSLIYECVTGKKEVL